MRPAIARSSSAASRQRVRKVKILRNVEEQIHSRRFTRWVLYRGNNQAYALTKLPNAKTHIYMKGNSLTRQQHTQFITD